VYEIKQWEVNKDKMKLYKYRPLTEHTYQSILNNYIWLSSPDTFNDPFDCHLRDDYFVFSNELVENDETDMFGNYNNGYYDHVIYPAYLANGVGCFSETNDGILMWSHYANSHQGVCLEYDFGTLSNYFYKVNYTSTYPLITYSEFLASGIKNSMNYIYKALYTKCKVWEYEKEWRIILPGYNNKKLEYSPKALNAIYLGCNISTNQFNKLVDTFSGNTYRPKIFQSKMDYCSFTLNYSLISE